MEGIRTAVVEGLHKIPHGGIEVGGILLGRRDADRLKATDWRLIASEHALGPSFTLSDSDEKGLRELIETARSEGLDVLGWFHSHTRSDLALSERDRELHERFFPDAWQLALLLRPAMLQPTRCAVFYRHQDGEWDRVGEPFVLEPPQKPEPIKLVEIVPEQAPRAAIPALHRRTPAAAPRLGDWKTVRNAFLAALGMILLTASLFTGWKLASKAPDIPMALTVQHSGGRSLISWNAKAPAVGKAEEGRLTIQDGEQTVEHRLTAADLRLGKLEYLRSAETLRVRLTLARRGKKLAEEWTSLIAPAAPRLSKADGSGPTQPATSVEPTENEKKEEAERAEALKIQEARIRAEMDRLEQARLKAEQERAATLKSQADRERVLHRMAEEAKAQLAKVEQLKAAAQVEAPAAVSHSLPDGPVQSPAVVQAPPLDLVKPGTSAPAAEPERPRYAGPSSGRLIWTGSLPRNGTLSIEEARTSIGALTGELPRQPIRIRAYPAELSEKGITIYTADPKHSRGVKEPPSRQNGWNPTTYKWDPGRASELTVLEAPGARNDWRKVVVRNDRKALSMVVFDWELARSARR